ncbi:signal recognition particle-docking protein FtsY [Dickeya solani]|uniref:Signal recognition particle receptor FtsY n=1 Tax=Dickeya solani D s0432-1 TaxID=1231725 RepID=A0AAV3KB23_9GAMM|nr:signal recognition particle-docking protein FtsY [Dickeya solani]ANE75309.1 signal recognition particle-docking protein FtsY [Dickeya solani IPO 2222]AUC42706.1 Signal recognition particle receptor protein FtsY (alpha subunit) [Dickeya solani RNS 08.23.3.1.A]AUH09277.1 signal recognition particle-docking protein FtsY [Dickeya solani D s0432-1]AUH13251.1 signal recognition particle-docking protein FtsY [Dickeya solani]AYQ49853.1 Signal recognition particle receptor FtsY [Dickeya solani]
MAKEKKRGFFSWLGLGRQDEDKTEQPQPAPEAPQADDATPAAPEPALHTSDEVSEQPALNYSVVETSLVETSMTETSMTETTQAETGETPSPESQPAEVAAEIPPTPVELPETAATPVVEPKADAEPQTDPEVEEDVEPEPEMVIVPAAPVASQEQERPTQEGFFARLKRSLVKTRQNLGSGFVGLFRGKKIDDELFDELEEQLLIADVGVETTRKIIDRLTEHASRKQLKDAEALIALLKTEMSDILAKVDVPLDIDSKTPFVILMVGVNGVGKTTTIGKLARQYQAQGKSVMLAAGDTFRAAAVEQLQVWGQRNNVPVVAQHSGADSASVIFDALQAAKARGVDVLIADTAGRLQNKSHLMEELKKIVRVMKKLDENAPHEVMLTLDASTGQNAVSQAKLFNEAVGLNGITLTKLDGTAKGGVIFAIADQFGIPIRYIGVGESIDDLRPFKADDFIEALFARED